MLREFLNQEKWRKILDLGWRSPTDSKIPHQRRASTSPRYSFSQTN
ncbi:hypothetical protein IQ217_09670 [Synechocystis salina LEGE 00031]|uniref:Uncharacterized protein n=1 Tax=Synechocystis salina LEGE 00031 TaxID=1828736 RepID=A0ABR9VRX0_9SYNC|nr:hypothetical protein [Synechocystis salina LEGE 00041]MBE9254101.1 hypothetical protein [Synechocystis salina LEGE 00031]